jgi:hypothetical protein
MSKLEKSNSKQIVVKATVAKEIPVKNVVEREQFDKRRKSSLSNMQETAKRFAN